MKEKFILEGKMIGWVEGDTFYSDRNQNHFFYKFEGFGASISVLVELQKKNIENFCIIFRKNMFQITEYNCKVLDFYNHGERFVDTSNDFEDPQLILPLEFWAKEGKKQERQTLLGVKQ